MQPVVRRRASRTVTVGVVAALAATLTGCGPGDERLRRLRADLS